MKDKGTVLMKELQVGDKVLTANGEYQTVYSFSHYHESKPTEYLQIYFANSKGPLEISNRHLVFLAAKKNPVPASQIKVGDKLTAQSGESTSTSMTDTVIKINKVRRDGLYAPFTADGTIAVNDVLASSFVTFQDSDSVEIGGYKVISYHLLEHMFEMPHRLFCAGLAGAGFARTKLITKKETLNGVLSAFGSSRRGCSRELFSRCLPFWASCPFSFRSTLLRCL